MAPALAAEGKPRGNAHHRQIGRHAGPFGDAAVKQVGQVGGIRHQEKAVQDGQILLGIAVDQVSVAVERVDGAGVLQQGQHRRDQQKRPCRAADQRFQSKSAEAPDCDAVFSGRTHTDKVKQQKNCLSGEEEIIVQQTDCHTQRENAAAILHDGIVQRREQVGKQRRGIQEEIEKDVIDIEAAEGIEHTAQKRHVVVPGPAVQPQVCAAARHGKFEAEHRRHQPGNPAGRHQNGQPEKRAAQRVIGIGIDKSAAQIRCPAETAALFDKGVGVGIKRDHLVIEVAGIVEEIPVDGVNDAVRGKQRSGQCQTDKKRPPVP